jgi:alkylhydroperoxidase family enzyme
LDAFEQRILMMARLNVVSPEQASGATKEIYDDLIKKTGKVVNIFQAMGNSAAALKAYLAMTAALAEGELSKEDREAVYLAVSEDNGCH